MPEISRFFGIVIRMYYREHAPPHFHAEYNGQEVVVNIKDLAIKRGKLSPKAMSLVIEWATLHQEELLIDWDKAINGEVLDKIEPLN